MSASRFDRSRRSSVRSRIKLTSGFCSTNLASSSVRTQTAIGSGRVKRTSPDNSRSRPATERSAACIVSSIVRADPSRSSPAEVISKPSGVRSNKRAFNANSSASILRDTVECATFRLSDAPRIDPARATARKTFKSFQSTDTVEITFGLEPIFLFVCGCHTSIHSYRSIFRPVRPPNRT